MLRTERGTRIAEYLLVVASERKGDARHRSSVRAGRHGAPGCKACTALSPVQDSAVFLQPDARVSQLVKGVTRLRRTCCMREVEQVAEHGAVEVLADLGVLDERVEHGAAVR